MRNKILLLFVFCLIFKPGISYSLVEIDITRGNLDPLPISVSPFFTDEISKEKIKNNLNIDNLGLEISKVIENNLSKTGLFNTLDRESFLQKPKRVWVHTCSLDHKNALNNYLSRGMKVFMTETVKI